MTDARLDGPITRQQAYDAMFLFLLDFSNRGAPSDDPIEWLPCRDGSRDTGRRIE